MSMKVTGPKHLSRHADSVQVYKHVSPKRPGETRRDVSSCKLNKQPIKSKKSRVSPEKLSNDLFFFSAVTAAVKKRLLTAVRHQLKTIMTCSCSLFLSTEHILVMFLVRFVGDVVFLVPGILRSGSVILPSAMEFTRS